MQKKYLFSLVLTSVFVAVTVVLSRFMSINVWNLSIGFSFVSIFICGMLLGPVWGGVCGALADFIGAILFPFGTYFFGFTNFRFNRNYRKKRQKLYGVFVRRRPFACP